MISSALFSYSFIDMLATSDSRIILADSSGSGAAALFVLTEDAAAFSSGLAFYRDLWPKRSHILGPLSKFSSCTPKNWVWGRDQQKAFEEVKEMIQKEALLQYPDFTKPFDLFTDASDIQLGATLVQEGKPLGFFTRKLNSAQRNYSVGEKELLSIVEGLKAFEGVIRCTDLTVHTDHLTCCMTRTLHRE